MITKDLEIVQGDDYAEADNRAFIFTSAGQNWPDLGSATLSFKVSKTNEDGVVFTTTPTHSEVGVVQTISVPVSASNSSLLQQGTHAYEYALQATISGRRLTLASAYITVRGDLL
jgi:hypothetical protein